MRPSLLMIIACSHVACTPPSPPPSAAPASPPSAATSAAPPGSAEEARDVCHRIRLATRACGELYVPALLRTRARFDQPPGIAARYKAEGEEKLLAIAREEFKADWSDASTASFCQKLVDMPVERRTAVVERERSCLPAAGDCAAFVECNVHNLERKWSAPPTPPATPPTK